MEDIQEFLEKFAEGTNENCFKNLLQKSGRDCCELMLLPLEASDFELTSKMLKIFVKIPEAIKLIIQSPRLVDCYSKSCLSPSTAISFSEILANAKDDLHSIPVEIVKGLIPIISSLIAYQDIAQSGLACIILHYLSSQQDALECTAASLLEYLKQYR